MSKLFHINPNFHPVPRTFLLRARLTAVARLSLLLLHLSTVFASYARADLLRSVHDGRWSSADTWDSQRVPAAGDTVLIRTGHTVLYDVVSDAVIRAVQVAGTLRFVRDADTRICAGLIKVQPGEDLSEEGFDCHGPLKPKVGDAQPLLEIGVAADPIPAGHSATIRLTYVAGLNPESCPALVSCGGRMEFHGAPLSRTWVKLGHSATRDSREVSLAEPVTGWRPGDHLLVTTTEMSEFYQEREGRRVIPSILDDTETEEGEIELTDGHDLLLKKPLKFKHQAIGQFRGEVANLSRNVVIESADPQGVRGHTMYHRNSTGSVSYVEFRHLGKRGVLGRYPIHFHLCGDTMRGGSVIGASIWESENRWLTVHGTDFLLIRDCVGFRCVGHGYFLEDGTEVYNVFDRNLAVQSLMGKPLPKQDLSFDPNDAAGFWWANCQNSFTRNVAVECEKYGFRFQMTKTPTFSPELSVRQADGAERTVDVRTLPFVRFEGNEAHSQRRFGFNLGGFHGQSETADLDRDGNVIDRASYLGSDVQGVGPDSRHPFQIKDYLVWRSQWGFHSAAPNVKIDGFTAHDVNYVVWRSNVAGHDYNNLHFSDIHVGAIFNGWGASASRENQLRYVDPVDDRPPITLINRWQWLGADRLLLAGVAVDDQAVTKVLVNDQEANLHPGPVSDWTCTIPLSGPLVTITAESVDAKGHRELSPHRLQLARLPDGGEIIKQSSAEAVRTPAPAPASAMSASSAASAKTAFPASAPGSNQDSTPPAASSAKPGPWPLWNTRESLASYAKRIGLPPAKIVTLHGVAMELILIPAGSFLMGASPQDPAAQADERPAHSVTLSRPFYLGKYELTQAQYQAVSGQNPSYFQGNDLPVEQVSWDEAQTFLQQAGQGLRLPTEAEWEFACRAGTATVYSAGDDPSALSQAGWWGHELQEYEAGNAPSGTSPVGHRAANAFGLFDLHGNVYEWCQDRYRADYYASSPPVDPPGAEAGDERVIRGGSWAGAAAFCRSSNRNAFAPQSRGFLLGFRVALSVPEK